MPAALRLALATLALAAVLPRAQGAGWEALPSSGRIVVNVEKTGLFSGFAHDHHFEVTEWRARADIPDGDPAGAAVEVVLSAGSLRDRQTSLSERDRRKVDAQAAGPDVLDAEHHPRIEFRAEHVKLEPAAGEVKGRATGTARGTLTLRGRERPVEIALEAERERDGWRVRGHTRVKQSDFGIRPFRGFGGTVGVKDELEIELDLTLHPSAGRP